jgi:parallel beta-helix repeat protein
MTRTSAQAVLLALALAAPKVAFAATSKTLDITSYGAIAADGKDDSAAIKAAIGAAVAGDTVRIPAGSFEIGSAVSAKSGVNLTGNGVGSSTLKFIGNTSTSLLNLDGVSNVALSGFTLDGNNSAKASQGIFSQNASKLNLSNLAVQNLGATSGFAPHGIYFSTNVTDSTISNSAFANIGTGSQWGAGIRLGQGSSRNQILANTIANTGRGGILCDNGSTDLVIRNNTITGSGKSGGGTGEGLGIELWSGCDRSIVEDNKLDHWLSVDSSNNLAVRRNVISDNTGAYKWCGIELVDAHDNVFTDNTVDGGAQIGISESGSGAKERIFWGNNTIKASSTWGIQIQGETGKASKQYFYKNTFTTSVKSGPKTLYAPQGHGVRFNGNANHIVFDANTITANQGSAFQVTDVNVTDLRILNNMITGNGEAAVDGSAPNTLWTGNTVTGNQTNNSIANSGGLVPTATLNQDDTALVGESLTFTIQAAGTGAITNVLWDFGEGLPVTTATASHVYTTPGTYRVTAIAWDAAGQAAFKQMTLNVSNSVPEPRGMLPAALLIGSVGMMAVRHRK